ncbi:MAG: pilin [Burkholderiaceae bacterium]|nr:pilin [Burkholderiaceae bacterium]
MSEGLTVAAAAKTTVAENAASGVSPLDQGWSTPSATDNISSLSVSGTNGQITIVTTSRAGSVTIRLDPSAGTSALSAGTIPTDRVSWKCVVPTAASHRYVPANCRNTS